MPPAGRVGATSVQVPNPLQLLEGVHGLVQLGERKDMEGSNGERIGSTRRAEFLAPPNDLTPLALRDERCRSMRPALRVWWSEPRCSVRGLRTGLSCLGSYT